MKKAKLFLTAAAVVAVAGGAFAFNANRIFGTIYCEASGTIDEACPGTAINFTLTIAPNSVPDPCLGVGEVAHVNSGTDCINVPPNLYYVPTIPGK